MASAFTFHQALFGYDSGHHLLNSSVQLPPEARHLLAVSTDLSGSAPPQGFEAAYTGLPLEGTNYYVVFCTWLAPEIPRPGCVWSHALLVELADLAEIPDLGALRHFFRRPTSKDAQDYQSPLTFRRKNFVTKDLSEEMKPRARQTLTALYLSPDRSIVATAKNDRETEDLVFAIWSQQWPRLRRNFRFSTGSFADRGRGGPPFDLQVTPTVNLRAWQRGSSHLVISKEGADDTQLTDGAQPWIDTVLTDLFAPDDVGFRSFLRTYGPDVDKPRAAFSRLTSAFEQLNLQPANDWKETLGFIGRTFPSPSEAHHLKESLVTLHDLPESEQSIDRIWATVSFLLTADESKAYATLQPDYTSLASRLWHSSKSNVLELLAQLVRRQENASAAAFALAVANCIQPNELTLISHERPELIPLFLSRRPSLAFLVEVWKLSTNTQYRIYEVLEGLSLDAVDWGKIMAAMFLASTDVAVRDVVGRAGSCAIESAFHWLDSTISPESLPSRIWREALVVPAANRLRDAEPLPPAKLAFCAWLVPPGVARQILSPLRKDVYDLALQPLDALPRPLRVPAAFLLVSLGLRSGDSEAVPLVAHGFFPVHDALATDQDPPESWSLLSPLLPRFAPWRQWDRCEKLRRTVRRRFPKHSEMPNALLQAAETPDHLEIVKLIYPGIIMKRLRASGSAKPPVLSSAPRVFWEFKRDQVERQDFRKFLDYFGELATGDVLRDSQASFTFFVGGFDDDAREVTEIPEIRAFYHKFYEVWPHWMFFIEPDSLKTMAFCILKTYMCIHDEKKRVVQHAYDDTEMAEFIEQQTPDFMSLCHRAGIDSIEANEILEGITKELMPPGWKKASGIKVS